MTAQERQERAARIRAARERIPTPTYQQIAQEVGCAEKTVYNVLTGKTHVERPDVA